VEQGRVLAGHAREEHQLGVQVLVHVLVVVQVVGREIQEQADVRLEQPAVLELEAGDFEDDDLRRVHVQQVFAQGHADVAAGEHPAARVFENGRDQGGGRGLAVGAGHGQYRGLDEPGGELQLRDHVLRRDALKHRGELLDRHARGKDDDVRVREMRLVVGAGDQFDLARQRAELFLGDGLVAVRHAHVRAEHVEQPRGGQPGLAGAHHHGLLAGQDGVVDEVADDPVHLTTSASMWKGP
jgi:hypothetical protein